MAIDFDCFSLEKSKENVCDLYYLMSNGNLNLTNVTHKLECRCLYLVQFIYVKLGDSYIENTQTAAKRNEKRSICRNNSHTAYSNSETFEGVCIITRWCHQNRKYSLDAYGQIYYCVK